MPSDATLNRHELQPHWHATQDPRFSRLDAAVVEAFAIGDALLRQGDEGRAATTSTKRTGRQLQDQDKVQQQARRRRVAVAY